MGGRPPPGVLEKVLCALPDLPQEAVRLGLLGLFEGVDGRQIGARSAPRFPAEGDDASLEDGYADVQHFAVRGDLVGTAKEAVDASYVRVALPAVDEVVDLQVDGVDEVVAGLPEEIVRAQAAMDAVGSSLLGQHRPWRAKRQGRHGRYLHRDKLRAEFGHGNKVRAEVKQDLLRKLGIGFVLLVVPLVVACGVNPDVQNPGRSGTDEPVAEATSRESGIFFPQQRPGPEAGPTALASGRLFVDEDGCLRVKPDTGPAWIPVWPASLELETEDRRIRIRNSEGQTVAVVGEKVFMGGGQVGLPKEIVDARTAHELRDRCSKNSGDYWMATDASLNSAIPQG